jgi:rubrerythrin
MKKGSAHSSNDHRDKPAGRARSHSRGSRVSSQWLKNFFSEMLAVERGGVQLYQRALDELTHEGLRPKLEDFHGETERHVEMCEEMLEAAGGDEGDASPGAEAAQHKAEGLLTAEVPDEMADINNIENLVLAETKDHWNWETLASLVSKLENGELKKIVSRAVREVRRQEKNHLGWAEKTLTQLAFEAAQQTEQSDQERSADETAQDQEAEAFD